MRPKDGSRQVSGNGPEKTGSRGDVRPNAGFQHTSAGPPTTETVTQQQRDAIANEMRQLLKQSRSSPQTSKSRSDPTPNKEKPEGKLAPVVSQKRRTKARRASTTQTSPGEPPRLPCVAPTTRYPPPELVYYDQASETIEWAAEVTAAVAKGNAPGPTEEVEKLKSVPVSQWPTIETLYERLWDASECTITGLEAAFDNDLRDLRAALFPGTPLESGATAGGLGTLNSAVKEEGEEEEGAMESGLLESGRKKRKTAFNTAVVTERKAPFAHDRLDCSPNFSGRLLESGILEEEPVDENGGNVDEEDPLAQHTALTIPPFLRVLYKVVQSIKKRERLQLGASQSLCRLISSSSSHSTEPLGRSVTTGIEKTVGSHGAAGVNGRDTAKRLDAERSVQRALWSAPWRRPVPVSCEALNSENGALLPPLVNQLLRGVFAGHNSTTISRHVLQPQGPLEAETATATVSLLRATLNHFQFLPQVETPWSDASWFTRSILRHFIALQQRQELPSYETTTFSTAGNADRTNNYSWPLLQNPFDWNLPSEPTAADHQDVEGSFPVSEKLLSINTHFESSSQRFYIGRASTIWGEVCGSGYEQVMLPGELLLWMRRFHGNLIPLDHRIEVAPPKHRPNSPTAAGASSATFGSAAALDAALALHTDSSLGSASLSRAGIEGVLGAVKVIEEPPSSTDSEPDGSEEDEGLESTAATVPLAKFAHDADVCRIGRFGILCSRWERRRFGHDSGAWDSEDSTAGIVDSQRPFRKQAKKYRRRRRQEIQALTAATHHPQEKNHHLKFLSALYQHGLGPSEDPFPRETDQPHNTRWPPSALNAYRNQIGEIRGVEDAAKALLLEDRWTYLRPSSSGGLRAMEPTFDRDPQSNYPMGFVAFQKDLSGAEHQLVGVDTNLFWRRLGDNKGLRRSLGNHADLMSGTRDYYGIIDDANSTATVVPGGTLSLFWTRSAEQNLYDLHWFALWRLWITGEFRSRFLKKALRYKTVSLLGYYLWREEIDRLVKLRERIIEASAYRNAKDTRLRITPCAQQRALLKEALPSMSQIISHSDPPGTCACLQDFSTFKRSIPVVDTTTPLECDGLPNVEAEAHCCRRWIQTEFKRNKMHTLSKRPNGCSPEWAWAWNGTKQQLRSRVSLRYARWITYYFQKTLPSYAQRYQETRAVIAEKHQAESEFVQTSRRAQQQPKDGASTTTERNRTLLWQSQLSSALSAMGKSDFRSSTHNKLVSN